MLFCLYVTVKMSNSNNPGYLKIDKHFGTKVTHVGKNPDQWTFKNVIPPISLSTTFKQFGPITTMQ